MPSTTDKFEVDVQGKEIPQLGIVHARNGCLESPDAEVEVMVYDPAGGTTCVRIEASVKFVKEDGKYIPIVSLKEIETKR